MSKKLYVIEYGRYIQYMEYYATTDSLVKANDIAEILNNKGFTVKIIELYEIQREISVCKPNDKHIQDSKEIK